MDDTTTGLTLSEWRDLDPNRWPHTHPLDVWQHLREHLTGLEWKTDTGHYVNLMEEALDRIAQLERERDEARSEASRIEGRAVEFSRRAEKAEAALERLESTFFANLLYLTIVSHLAFTNENGEALYDRVLALIRNETGGDGNA